MKRIVGIFLLGAMLLALCSCGGGPETVSFLASGSARQKAGALSRRPVLYAADDGAALDEDAVRVLLDEEETLLADRAVLNILLIGTDARSKDERARSDVMLLVSLNRDTKKIVLTSFMRDIYTEIAGHGNDRLNAAYALDGADCLIATLEADFGVKIDYYAAVTFYAFADIIDVIGGLDLELTNAEVDFINEQAYDGEQAYLGVGTGSVYLEYSSDGVYHLNGTQALAYCRNRSSAGSDFDRTNRQRTTIAAIADKAGSLTMLQIVSLVKTALEEISTDLTFGKCLYLLVRGGEYLSYDIDTLRIPGDGLYSGTMINGMSVLEIDFAANAQLLQDTIYS